MKAIIARLLIFLLMLHPALIFTQAKGGEEEFDGGKIGDEKPGNEKSAISDSTVVYAVFKVGDNGDIKDGFLVDYYDPLDWGKDPAYSDNMKTVFSIIKFKRADYLDSLKKWVRPVGDSIPSDPVKAPIKTAASRARGIKVNFDSLAKAANIPTYAADVRDKAPSEVLDLTTLSESKKLLTSTATLNPAAVDHNAIAAGVCSVGTSQTYATWAAFTADLAATLTGDVTARQMTATTSTSQSGITANLAGHTLTMTSNIDPKGNFSAGYQSTYNANTNAAPWFSIAPTSAAPGAVVLVSNLNLKYIGADASSYNSMVSFGSNSANVTNKINNCVIDGNGHNTDALRTETAGTILKAYNCVLVNCVAGNSKYAIGIFMLSSSTSTVFENITINNCTATGGVSNGGGVWNYANIAVTFKNVAAFNCTRCFGQGSSNTAGFGAATGTKCAASDTTASEAGLRSLNSATEFVSTTITDSTYLKVKTYGVLDDGGAATSLPGNSVGIRGNARPTGSAYSIGADQIGSITVTAPNGGESWLEATSQNITWTSNNVMSPTVSIYLTRDNSTYTRIDSGVTNSGTRAWTVTTGATADAKFKVVSNLDTGIFDISDAVFTITSPTAGGLMKYFDIPMRNPFNRITIGKLR